MTLSVVKSLWGCWRAKPTLGTRCRVMCRDGQTLRVALLDYFKPADYAFKTQASTVKMDPTRVCYRLYRWVFRTVYLVCGCQ